MSGQLGELVVSLSADVARFRSDMGAATREAQSAADKIARSHQESAEKIKQFYQGFQVILGTLGVSQLTRQLYEAGVAAEKMRNGLEVAMGGLLAGGNAMAFLSSESNRLGLDLQSTSSAFVKLAASAKGTSLEGEKILTIFSSVATAGRALNLSTDEMSGALLAVSQMISKGTVQAEELRGQLGERLPGAFQIAARAMGVSTQELGKMLEQGKVVADDFLPKFAAELQKTYQVGEKALTGLTAETSKLKNAWFDLKTTVMQSGGDSAFTAMAKMLRHDLESVKKIFDSIDDIYNRLSTHPWIWENKPVPLGNKSQPLNNFDVPVMGLGGGTSVDTSDTDWLFRNKVLTTPLITQQQISANSVVVHNMAVMQDEIRDTTAAQNQYVETWNKLQDRIRSMNPDLTIWQKEIQRVNDEYDTLIARYPEHKQQLESNRQVMLSWVDLANEQKQAISETAAEFKRLQDEWSNQEPEHNNAGAMRERWASELEWLKGFKPTREMEDLQEQLATIDKMLEDMPELATDAEAAIKKINSDMKKITYPDKPMSGVIAGLEEYSEAAQDMGKQMKNFTVNTFNGMEDALVNFVKTGKMSFKDLADSIISDLIRISIQKSITGPLASAIGSGIGSLFGQANGGAWSNGVQMFANGGVVSSPTAFGMAGGGLGVMGEAGPEAVMPLSRTSNGRLGVDVVGGLKGATSPNVTILIENKSGGEVKQGSTNVQFDGKDFVISTIIENVRNNGPLRGLMAGAGAY